MSREEEIVLAFEEIVEGALLDLGQRRHFIHPRAFDTAATTDLMGGIEDSAQLVARRTIGSGGGHGATPRTGY